MRAFITAIRVPSFVLASLAAVLFSSGVSANETRLLRFPDIHRERVVFTYAGDIWTVSANGGDAVRLTAHPGVEAFPKFSPDGKWIAFTGQYEGEDQVYLMPAGGGEPRQLTFYPARGPLTPRWGVDNQVQGWARDGKSVLFRSLRDHFNAAQSQLYKVSTDDSDVQVLAPPLAGAGALSPDGASLLYSPLTRDFRTWKRYQSGWAQDLWVYNLAQNTARNITSNARTDRDPMWTDKGIFFVSDRDDYLNIYAFDEATNDTRQITHYSGSDVRWASADANGQIVYELDGALHVVDGASGEDVKLTISVADDGLARRAETIKVGDKIEEASLSPDGKHAMFVARGDIFITPVKPGGITRNLTRTSTAHDRGADWSDDAKTIAFLSDASGEEEIWLAPADGRAPPRQLTKGHQIRLYGPVWAPGSKRLAVRDNEGFLHVVDAKSGAMTKIGNLGLWYNYDYRWSPDGRYLAYTFAGPNFFGAIHVWDSKTGADHLVTDPQFNSRNPSWDPKGRFLYFLSDRTFAPQMGWIEWNYVLDRAAGVYALALGTNVSNPFTAYFEADGAKKQKPPASINFAGLAKRVMRLPIEADRYTQMQAFEDKLLLIKSGPFYYGRDNDVTPSLVSYSIADRKTNTMLEGARYFSASKDASTIFVQKPNDAYQLIANGDDPISVSTDTLTMRRAPREEWATIFNEVWRRYRDFFYVRNMHGYDWQALRQKYADLLDDVGDRSDLNYLMGEMIGELNVSHAYVSGGDLRRPDRPNTGTLGARLTLNKKSNRYLISTILEGQNEEPLYRSPLTEVGVNVSAGDYLLAINGVPLTGADNPYALLRGQAGKPVELLVNNKPSPSGARRVVVQTLNTDRNLIYLNWVLKNKRRVAEASNGRLGYLHIPDMGAAGIREFIKGYYGQIRAEGMVIDVRGNDGGSTSQMILNRLTSPQHFTGYARGQQFPTTFPWGNNTSGVFTGALATLANEDTMSDGDAFTWSFKNAKRGPVIGKRTWGGTVGIGLTGPLLDGGTVYVPQYALADAQGRWIVEGTGVEPDIEVDNDPASLLDGRDNQLERAIVELMATINAAPQGLSAPQQDPVKTPR
jgi:tricorn protease